MIIISTDFCLVRHYEKEAITSGVIGTTAGRFFKDALTDCLRGKINKIHEEAINRFTLFTLTVC